MKVPSVPARTQSTHLVSFCGTVRGVTKPQHKETNDNQKRHDGLDARIGQYWKTLDLHD